ICSNINGLNFLRYIFLYMLEFVKFENWRVKETCNGLILKNCIFIIFVLKIKKSIDLKLTPSSKV
ncbi:TPA: hypothetical protein ACOIAL_003454, partial [Clostridioides difficile]